MMGIEDGGLGDSNDDLAGKLIAGNDFNYVKTHAEAIQSAGDYNIVSCASAAVETAKVSLNRYDMVDLVLGLERNDGHSTEYYKTFDAPMQHALQGYTRHGGKLMVSGAYVGCDMTAESEQTFLANVLRCRYAGRSMAETNEVKGMGTTLYYYKNLNEEHYAAPSTDILQPTSGAITAM